MSRNVRFAIGAILGPLIIPTIFFLGPGLAHPSKWDALYFDKELWMFVAFAMISYLVNVPIGALWVLGLRMARRFYVPEGVAFAVILGLLASLFYELVVFRQEGLSELRRYPGVLLLFISITAVPQIAVCLAGGLPWSHTAREKAA